MAKSGIEIELVPIPEVLEECLHLTSLPDQKQIVEMSVGYYLRIGYNPPWIGYCVRQNGEWVGAAGYKGKPVDGKIEISYGTHEPFRNRGIATAICRELVLLALRTDPSVVITARTLPEANFSTQVLKNNRFTLSGTVLDDEDGEVWEWIYQKAGN